MSDNSRIWGKISAVNKKITDCSNAKSSVQSVRNSCTTTKTQWQEHFNVLQNDGALLNVQKKDVFEGEMAESLKGKVGEASTQISTGITKSGNLEDALNRQITKLDNKIIELESERSALYSQLD